MDGALGEDLLVPHQHLLVLVWLARHELTLDEDLGRSHFLALSLYQRIHQVFGLLSRPIGAQYALALAQERVFVVVRDVVQRALKRSHRLVQRFVQLVVLLDRLLAFSLGHIELLREVLLEVLLQHLVLLLLTELHIHCPQLQTLVRVLVKEALKEGVELLASDLPHLLFGEAALLVDVDVGAVLGDQLHDSKLLSLLVRSPLVLPPQLPLGLDVGWVLPVAVSVDVMPYVALGQPVGSSVFARGRPAAVLAGVDTDGTNLF